jgi:hypothetical protein
VHQFIQRGGTLPADEMLKEMLGVDGERWD